MTIFSYKIAKTTIVQDASPDQTYFSLHINTQIACSKYDLSQHRITSSKILQNIESRHFSNQLLNNLQIGLNCTKIAFKYSKCYLCRIWLVKYPLSIFYQMSQKDQVLQRINQLFLSQCPIPSYTSLFDRFYFQNKGLYSALSLIQSSKLKNNQLHQITYFLTALELVNLGFSLHHSVGKSHKLNLITRIALKLMSKQMKDSYLVLGGDYFHIQGSVLASETNNVRLSELLSEVEIDLCKYVHFTEQLKKKVLASGYDSISIKEIYKISILKTSPIVKGMMAVDLITNTNQEDKKFSQQIYEIIGLIILYRKDLQNFMFNFKDIVRKYFEYKQNKINFDSQQSLPYFIFFQGAHQNKRIDLSYLNAVTMMSQQIEYLQIKLRSLIGSARAEQLQKNINYYLMIYS